MNRAPCTLVSIVIQIILNLSIRHFIAVILHMPSIFILADFCR